MSRLVMATRTSPTMTGGQTYLDFSAHGQSVLTAVAYVDGSGSITSATNKWMHDVSLLLGSAVGKDNLVYVSCFSGGPDISQSGWSNATTADLAGKRVVVIADVE